jgi:hypothetical protein
MKPRKPKSAEPSLRDKLSQAFLETLEADFRVYGATVIETMRQTDPTRYAELAGKLIMTAEPVSKGIDFNSANSMDELGLKLLQSIGFTAPSDEQIQQAIAANNAFIAKLEAIRDCASAPEDEVH